METNWRIQVVMLEHYNSPVHFGVDCLVDSTELSLVTVPAAIRKQQAKQTIDTGPQLSQSIHVRSKFN
jgi:hypothetical protein